MYEGSTKLESAGQLVELGLMHDTDAWASARAIDAMSVDARARHGEHFK
jgi:hypothetical protein